MIETVRKRQYERRKIFTLGIILCVGITCTGIAMVNTDNAWVGSDFLSAGSNTVSGDDGLAVGVGNNIVGTGSAAIGWANYVSGWRSLAVGGGLKCADYGSVVCGVWNKAVGGLGGQDDGLLVVGNGGADSTRRNVLEVTRDGNFRIPSHQVDGTKNRFEVLADGSVVIGEAQGDIGMGTFD